MTTARWMGAAVLAVACVVGAVACGSSDDVAVDCTQGAGCIEAHSGAVSCRIDDPTDHEEVGGRVPVNFTIDGLEVRPPGGCNGRLGCGHPHLFVEDCSAKAESSARSALLDLSRCRAGEQRVVLVLHDDRHAVLVRDEKPIASAVTVRVKEGVHRDANGDCDCDGKDKDKDKDCDSH